MESTPPQIHLPRWLQGIVATTGGLGLFLIAFLDSSVLTFPVINYLLLIDLSIHYPGRMLYYSGMATFGSVVGCVLLYYIARNGFVSILVTALLPPPTPFKIFVIAAGALKMPVRTFVLGLIVARGFRFFAEGFLAVKYGNQGTQFLLTHKLEVAGIALAVVLALYLASRLAFSHPTAT